LIYPDVDEREMRIVIGGDGKKVVDSFAGYSLHYSYFAP
jgi:hypothetical protein